MARTKNPPKITVAKSAKKTKTRAEEISLEEELPKAKSKGTKRTSAKTIPRQEGSGRPKAAILENAMPGDFYVARRKVRGKDEYEDRVYIMRASRGKTNHTWKSLPADADIAAGINSRILEPPTSKEIALFKRDGQYSKQVGYNLNDNNEVPLVRFNLAAKHLANGKVHYYWKRATPIARHANARNAQTVMSELSKAVGAYAKSLRLALPMTANRQIVNHYGKLASEEMPGEKNRIVVWEHAIEMFNEDPDKEDVVRDIESRHEPVKRKAVSIRSKPKTKPTAATIQSLKPRIYAKPAEEEEEEEAPRPRKSKAKAKAARVEEEEEEAPRPRKSKSKAKAARVEEEEAPRPFAPLPSAAPFFPPTAFPVTSALPEYAAPLPTPLQSRSPGRSARTSPVTSALPEYAAPLPTPLQSRSPTRSRSPVRPARLSPVEEILPAEVTRTSPSSSPRRLGLVGVSGTSPRRQLSETIVPETTEVASSSTSYPRMTLASATGNEHRRRALPLGASRVNIPVNPSAYQ